MSFKEKVQQMTASEIIMAMVNGLEKKYVNIDMGSYGHVDRNNVCYGCAATNAICEINGGILPINAIHNEDIRVEYLNIEFLFLVNFELAIDSLRSGDLIYYNANAKKIGMAQINNPNNSSFVGLTTSNYQNNLEQFIQLAKDQC